MDLLQLLFLNYPYSEDLLQQMICGEKNVAFMLSNGNIGVCSTLCHSIEVDERILKKPNFSKYDHRIVVNAWVNAFINSNIVPTGNSDIFDAIDFTIFKHVVMIGYFGSLSQKLMQSGINLSVFDLDEENKPVKPINKQKSVIQTADAVILTATSLSNNTFQPLINIVPSIAKVYILGPSTPLSQLFFNYPQIEGLFGARFKPFQIEVLESIRKGGGTRSFLEYMEKVFVLRSL